METSIRVTRRELIQTRSRIKVAKRGLELLKMKRSAMMIEFFKLLRKLQEVKEDLRTLIERGNEAVRIAEAVTGRMTVERVAQEQSEKSARVGGRNVMGLIIPDIGLNENVQILRGSDSITIPTAVYDAKNSYLAALNTLIQVSEQELAIRRLLREIYKLNRRANSIENRIIPSWTSKMNYIKQSLDDMERDRLVSIKFIKRVIS